MPRWTAVGDPFFRRQQWWREDSFHVPGKHGPFERGWLSQKHHQDPAVRIRARGVFESSWRGENFSNGIRTSTGCQFRWFEPDFNFISFFFLSRCLFRLSRWCFQPKLLCIFNWPLCLNLILWIVLFSSNRIEFTDWLASKNNQVHKAWTCGFLVATLGDCTKVKTGNTLTSVFLCKTSDERRVIRLLVNRLHVFSLFIMRHTISYRVLVVYCRLMFCFYFSRHWFDRATHPRAPCLSQRKWPTERSSVLAHTGAPSPAGMPGTEEPSQLGLVLHTATLMKLLPDRNGNPL